MRRAVAVTTSIPCASNRHLINDIRSQAAGRATRPVSLCQRLRCTNGRMQSMKELSLTRLGMYSHNLHSSKVRALFSMTKYHPPGQITINAIRISCRPWTLSHPRPISKTTTMGPYTQDFLLFMSTDQTRISIRRPDILLSATGITVNNPARTALDTLDSKYMSINSQFLQVSLAAIFPDGRANDLIFSVLSCDKVGSDIFLGTIAWI